MFFPAGHRGLILVPIALLAIAQVDAAVLISGGNNPASHICAILDDHSLKCWGKDAGRNAALGYGYGPPVRRLLTARYPGASTRPHPHSCRWEGDKCRQDTEDACNAAKCGKLHIGTCHCSWQTYGTCTATSTAPHACKSKSVPCLYCEPPQGRTAGEENLVSTCNAKSLYRKNPYSCYAPPQGHVHLGENRTAVAVVTGTKHNSHGFTCAILDNGSVKCWGAASSGYLGYGKEIATNAVTGLPHTQLEYTHACMWNTACRKNAGGQPSCIERCDRPPNATLDLGPGRTAVKITASVGHACVITDVGGLMCWGYNDRGVLGVDPALCTDGISDYCPSPTEVDLGLNRTAVDISTGFRHTCVVVGTGDVLCWGKPVTATGSSGKCCLGYGTNECGITTPPVDRVINLGANRTAIQVSVGDAHTCAVLDTSGHPGSSGVKCWGRDFDGALGYGSKTKRNGFGGNVYVQDLFARSRRHWTGVA